MTRKDLLELSIGENIDRLITLDMRGCGIPRILYAGAREQTKEPVCLHGTKALYSLLREGDYLFFMTGFVFEPYGKGELDGLTGTVMITRALLMACKIKPVIFCEEKLTSAVRNVLQSAGINAYGSIEEIETLPNSAAVIGISLEPAEAAQQCKVMLERIIPKAVFAIEKPGKNVHGVYHQGTGTDVSRLCAKLDSLFTICQERGIPTFAIGDLGNEIGLGKIGETIRAYIPQGDRCICGCDGGLCVATSADHLIVATTSDWACYGVTAALAAITGKPDLIPTAAIEKRVCECANDNDLIDGSGRVIPSIDGIALDFNMMLVEMLRQVVAYPLQAIGLQSATYDAVLEKGFFKS